jgi:energy-coupling factor transport system substrate-specific component
MKKFVDNYNIAEITFICVMSVIMGLCWSAYTFIYNIISPIFKATGLESLFTGVWLMGAMFFPYIIRKPGAAIFGEGIAALIEGLISHWGIGAILYGILQAIPAEIVFFATSYKKFNYQTICIAGLLSGIGGAILSIIIYQYYKFGILYCVIYTIGSAISGIILGGVVSKLLADRLYNAGVLNQYKIALQK